MRELTKEEALRVANNLSMDDYIHHGSSRAVFDYMFEGRHCVVKIALDEGGHNQNKIERECYVEHGHEGFLAELIAFYDNILAIYEFVEVTDEQFVEEAVEYGCDATDDVECSWNEEEQEMNEVEMWRCWNYTNAEECQRVIEEYREVYNALCDYQGETSDNTQIGVNESGKAVAYDYGYIVGYEHGIIVGNIYTFLNDGIVLDELIYQIEAC